MSLERISFKEKVGYGFGDAASSMFWKLFGMYLLFFYTDVFGITAKVAGLIILISRMFDAVVDPGIGILGDRTNTRWGKFRPYLLWVAIPFGVVGVLTFTTPELGMTGKIVYAAITYFFMMVIYSFINVPYASLMGVMTADGKMRTTLATYRFIFAFGGSFLVFGLYQPLFNTLGTKVAATYSDKKIVEVNDSLNAGLNTKTFIWQGTKSEEKEQLQDTLLYLTAKVTTSSAEAFKIGIFNPANNNYSWFGFPAGKDTLGLHRNGATSDVQIRLSKITSPDNLTDPGSLQVAINKPGSDNIKIANVAIKQINYRTGIRKSATIIAGIAVIFFLLTFLWTKERIKPIEEKTSLRDDLKDLGKNGPWFILLGAGISTIFFNTIRDSAAVYYFMYYYKGPGNIALGTNLVLAISTIYLLLGQAANMLGVFLAKPVSDKIGKKNTFLYAMMIATVLSIIFYFLDRTNIKMIYTFQILISINAGIIFPMLWSMYADSADYSEWKSGRRATGLVFSAASMSQKFGASLGIYLVSLLLLIYGYKANMDQTAVTQQGLRMMLSIYPAIGAILAALFMFIYPLNESLLTKIETELGERRKKSSQK